MTKISYSNLFLKISRLLFGATFLFSGFVKAVDPIGFAYKIEDYLVAFNLSSLSIFALIASVLLISLEFLIGSTILMGIFKKASTSLGVLFMLIMTPLTLYIALQNPVSDCGCFGDAFIISNWNTFYKNIVLLSLIIFISYNRSKINSVFSDETRVKALVFLVLFVVGICLYSIIYLPIIDFRPYRTGVNIKEQMEKDMLEQDVYDNIYIYEKNGVKKEFIEAEIPWQDSTWTFIDVKHDLIKEGEKPVIEDFEILLYEVDSNDNFIISDDITEEILADPNIILVISTSLGDISTTKSKQLLEMIKEAEKTNLNVIILTASGPEVVKLWSDKTRTNKKLRFAAMDERTLKTIIRSNPGFLLMQKGTIIKKWSKNRISSIDTLTKSINQPITTPSNNKSNFNLLIVCLIFIIPILGLKLYDKKYLNK